MPAAIPSNVTLVFRSANGLPCRNNMHGKLQVHGNHEHPNDLGLPPPGHQTQQGDAKRRLGDAQGDGLKVMMRAGEGYLQQGAGD